MKTFLRKTWLIALMLVLGASTAWAEKTYTKVTDASTLSAGDVIILACDTKNVYAGPMGDNTYFSSVSARENAIEFTLSGNASGWKMTTSEGTVGASQPKALSKATGVQTWKITITNGNASITNTTAANGTIQYNASSPRFLNYATNQTAIQIYKVASGTSSNPSDPSWSTNPESVSVEVGKTATLTYSTNYNGTLYIESSDEEIATVATNGTTVTVTGVKAGETTIYFTGSATSTVKEIYKTVPVVVTAATGGGDSGEGGNGDETQSLTITFDNLGYESWGKEASFSGDTNDEVEQTKDRVKFTYTRNTGSLYANSSAIRFYKTNELSFAAPSGYSIISIEFTGSNFKEDATTDVKTCTSSTDELSWKGRAKAVVFTRPSTATNYMTLSKVTVTLAADEGGSDIGGGEDDKTATLSIANITVAMDEGINPVITTNVTGDYLIEYVSDNEEVVLAADDELVTMGVGSATITATLVADGYTTAETTFTVTVTAGESTGDLSPIPNFIKTASVEIALNGEPYDVRQDLNIPKDYDNADGYSITTTINGVEVDAEKYACTYSSITFSQVGTYIVHVVAKATDKYAKTEGDIKITVFDSSTEIPVYASLAELVNAGKPTSPAKKVTVTLIDEEITKFQGTGDSRKGLFLISGTQEVEIYCSSTAMPEEWTAGGTISGTLTNCDWWLYQAKWELCPADWSELTYTAPAPVEVETLTTIDAIFEKAINVSTTATEVNVTFDNWVVSGVKNSNAYVTNGTKGFIIYTKDHGFEVGDILSGTAACKVQLYRGAAELTELKASAEGLTVTKGGSLTPQSVSISDLSGINTGTVISLSNMTYVDNALTDGENRITPYGTFMTLPEFIEGSSYNVKGIFILFDNTKEIAPRSEEDIEDINADSREQYTITWKVYNEETTEEAYQGTNITFAPAEVPAGFIGYEFRGWVEDATLINPEVEPSYITSAIATGNVTYKAVFAKKEVSTSDVVPTSISEYVDGNYIIVDTYTFDDEVKYFAMKGAPNKSIPAVDITSAVSFNEEDGSITIDMTAECIIADMVYSIAKADGVYNLKNAVSESNIKLGASGNDLVTIGGHDWIGFVEDVAGGRFSLTAKGKNSKGNETDNCLLMQATQWDSNLSKQVPSLIFKGYNQTNRGSITEKAQCYTSGYMWFVPTGSNSVIYNDFTDTPKVSIVDLANFIKSLINGGEGTISDVNSVVNRILGK